MGNNNTKCKNKTTTSTAVVLKNKEPSKNKNQQFDEAMPVIWKNGHYGIKRIIWDFAFDPIWLKKPFSFSHSSLEQEILALAAYAAPLDDVERYIREAHTRKEKHLPTTLVKAAIKAIQNLDVTIRDEKGNVIAEGMAEKLMKLHEELLPDTFLQSLTQVNLSIPFETKEEKEARKNTYTVQVNRVLDAINPNDDKSTDKAIEKFKHFASDVTQLNRLHLLFAAFLLLEARRWELTIKWMHAAISLSDKLCLEVIATAIEKDFSPRMRKILDTGVFYILNSTKKVERRLDIDEKPFTDDYGNTHMLGTTSYCTAYGHLFAKPTVSSDGSPVMRRVLHPELLSVTVEFFSKFIKSNDLSIAALCGNQATPRKNDT